MIEKFLHLVLGNASFSVNLIGIDGPYYKVPSVQESDNLRDDELDGHGFTVMRFKNNEILYDLNGIPLDILRSLHDLPSSG